MSDGLSNGKVTNIPKVLGMISFVISLASIPYAYFISSILVAINKGYKLNEIFEILDKKAPHVIAPIVFSILIAILITIIGIGAFVLSLIALKYFKIAYVGFFICSFFYFLLIIPSKGASLVQSILCLVAGVIGFRNYKKYEFNKN